MLLYSTTGGTWKYPVRITYSIVPDGTSIGGTPSNLQQTLSSHSGWQQQFQKAAAAWEAVAGINLVQVPDNGAPIGSNGNQQGDTHFGDIRIGGMRQSLSQLAFAFSPQPFNGGSNAGDIFFNTAQLWQTNGTTYDLTTTAIHEFGHALGMSHSAITTAVMYASYNGTKQLTTSDDQAGLRSIYSTRRPDAFDAAASNNSSTYASNVTPYINNIAQIALACLDISSNSDIDWYKVTVPASTTGNMVVTMQSSTLSSLTPRVTVYNGNLQGGVMSTGSNIGDTVHVNTAGVVPGQTWYIKAMAGVTGAAGIGVYSLLVNFGSSYQAATAPPYTVVAAQPDQNPTTTPLGVQGWFIGGQLILYLGILDALVGQVIPDLINGLFLITYGTLSGYGDTLEVGDSAIHDHHPVKGGVACATHHHEHDQQRDANTSDDFSGAPIIPLAVNTDADSNQGGPRTMFHHRNEAPRRAESMRQPGRRCRALRLAARRPAQGAHRSPGDDLRKVGPPTPCHFVLTTIPCGIAA